MASITRPVNRLLHDLIDQDYEQESQPIGFRLGDNLPKWCLVLVMVFISVLPCIVFLCLAFCPLLCPQSRGRNNSPSDSTIPTAKEDPDVEESDSTSVTSTAIISLSEEGRISDSAAVTWTTTIPGSDEACYDIENH